MLPSSIHPQKCALCEEPATHACGDCKDTPSIAGQMEETTYYCTRACQMLDRASHKEHCKRLKPRKELYRAGKILLSMFLLFREKVYDGTIIRAERRDSKLFIHNGEVFPPDRDIDILAPFPASVFDDLEAKHAALTALACNDASAWMHDMIDYFLSDLTVAINEVTINVSNPDLKVILVSPKGKENPIEKVPHDVVLLALHSEEQYVLNLAGAQHGHFEPIVHFDTYFKNHIGRFENGAWTYSDIKPFGCNKGALLTNIPRCAREASSIHIFHDSSRVLQPACKGWLEKRDLTVWSLLKLKQTEFEKSIEDLLTHVGLELDAWRARFEEQSATLARLGGNVDL